MNKSWLFGGILFISLAANAVLGMMQLGKTLQLQQRPAKIVMARLARLPEAERAQAESLFKQALPQLREQVINTWQLRKDTFRYIASAEYSRELAETRLAELRERTTTLQKSAQKLILDIADTLPTEQRAKLLDNVEFNLP
ncbi:MAG: hypothetical protein WC782_15935 [Methylococcaceae bacterium]|jgi:hypothetical protein